MHDPFAGLPTRPKNFMDPLCDFPKYNLMDHDYMLPNRNFFDPSDATDYINRILASPKTLYKISDLFDNFNFKKY